MDEVINFSRTLSVKPNVTALASAEILSGKMQSGALAQPGLKIALGAMKPSPYAKMIEGITASARFKMLDQVVSATKDWSAIADATKRFSFNLSAEQIDVLDQQRLLGESVTKNLAPLLSKSVMTNVFEGIELPLTRQPGNGMKAGKLLAANYASMVSTPPRPIDRIAPSVVRLAPPRRRWIEPHSETEDFLFWVSPELVLKYRGAPEALVHSSDGVSQAANSVAELLRHMFNRLVPELDVFEHMEIVGALDPSKKRPQHPEWRYRLELMAIRYNLDIVPLQDYFGRPSLSRCAEDIKHDTHQHTRGELLRLVAGVEDFLDYLAMNIDRSQL